LIVKLNIPEEKLTKEDKEFEDRVWSLKAKLRSEKMKKMIEALIA